MTKPLALVLYEKVLPGGQLVNRLQDIGYRVSTISPLGKLVEAAAGQKPLIVFADLVSREADVPGAIARLKESPETSHLPVIAFAPEEEAELQQAARKAGANLVVNDSAILTHLNQWLDQALQVD